jgi:hypothetical protein
MLTCVMTQEASSGGGAGREPQPPTCHPATQRGPDAGGGGSAALPARAPPQHDVGRHEDYGRSVHSDYEIGETLGKGSFAVVKEGWKKSTGQKFAIKIIEKNNPGIHSFHNFALKLQLDYNKTPHKTSAYPDHVLQHTMPRLYGKKQPL